MFGKQVSTLWLYFRFCMAAKNRPIRWSCNQPWVKTQVSVGD
jgi:hypothetical protein